MARSSQRRPVVVIDTNVWISGVIFGGVPKKVLELFITGQIHVVVSHELLSELRRSITSKFPLFLPHLAALESSITERAVTVSLGRRPVTASRDPDDNKIIETAVEGSASYIITGDKDLLVIENYAKIIICTAKEFLTQY